MSKGLSNYQIDHFFKENEDFKKIIWACIQLTL